MDKFKIGDRVRYTGVPSAQIDPGDILLIKQRFNSVGYTSVYDVSTASGYETTVWEHELEPTTTIVCPVVENVGGTKHDTGKPDFSLLSTISLMKIAAVLTYGKTKYAAHNWRKGMSWTRISSAVLRHIFAWIGGESKDPETGISHLASAACGLIFLLEFEDTHPELDDRYKSDVG